MKFDSSNKFDFCYYGQVNSNVASKLLLNPRKQYDKLKGLLDYAILWEISLLRKKKCLESCKQEQ